MLRLQYFRVLTLKFQEQIDHVNSLGGGIAEFVPEIFLCLFFPPSFLIRKTTTALIEKQRHLVKIRGLNLLEFECKINKSLL